jgi:hypothetical protein
MREAVRDLPVKGFPGVPQELLKEPRPPKPEESGPSVMGLSAASARIALSRAGYNVVVITACPPGGGRGIRVWKQEVRGDTVYLWKSRAVCN